MYLIIYILYSSAAADGEYIRKELYFTIKIDLQNSSMYWLHNNEGGCVIDARSIMNKNGSCLCVCVCVSDGWTIDYNNT